MALPGGGTFCPPTQPRHIISIIIAITSIIIIVIIIAMPIIIRITVTIIIIIIIAMPIIRTIIMMMSQPWRPVIDFLPLWPAAATRKFEGPKIGRAPK